MNYIFGFLGGMGAGIAVLNILIIGPNERNIRTLKEENRALMETAIRIGAAQYDPHTGQFSWKEP